MDIKNLKIDTTQMSNVETVRQFVVTGDIGARFQILALQTGTNKYYDFKETVFEAGHNDLNNNLIVTLSTNTYQDKITFPSGGGDYVVKLISINGTPKIITKNISKAAATVRMTFQAESITNTSSYETLPTTVSDGAINSSTIVNFDWSVLNQNTDANGFGLLQKTPSIFKFNLLKESSVVSKYIDRAWYFKTTKAVNGLMKGFTPIVPVVDVTGLSVGMVIVGVSSGSLVGTPFIKKIGITNPHNPDSNSANNIELSSDLNDFAADITLTFKAYGSKDIFLATGAKFSFKNVTITATPLEKSVRANVSSSTSVTLNNTLGIAGGDIITYSGAGVNNASNNRITSVTPDPTGGDTDGVAVVELAQTLSAGTTLYFKGCHEQIDFQGTVKIDSFPTANRTINFDLDLFLAVGAAS